MTNYISGYSYVDSILDGINFWSWMTGIKFKEDFWLLIVLYPSSARLGSARIQLELEGFQLGSAQLVVNLDQLVWQRLWQNKLF